MEGQGRQRRRHSEDFDGGEPSLNERARSAEHECLDFCPICRTAEIVRATMPAELQEHWHSVQRELLLTVRSLVDHYLQHGEGERPKVVHVEDIPIQ